MEESWDPSCLAVEESSLPGELTAPKIVLSSPHTHCPVHPALLGSSCKVINPGLMALTAEEAWVPTRSAQSSNNLAALLPHGIHPALQALGPSWPLPLQGPSPRKAVPFKCLEISAGGARGVCVSFTS